MKILAVINQKGGVGKSTTAAAIAAGLLLKGYKVLAVDLDAQSNLTYNYAADNKRATALGLLTGEVTATDAIQHTKSGDIIAASKALAGADAFIADTGKEYRLKEALEDVKPLYDYIIIDTPPALGILTINALTACHSVIIPAQADIYSLQGIEQLYGTIEAVKHFANKKLTIEGILLTRYAGRSVISKDMRDNLEELSRAIGTKVFKTPIRECVAIREAQAMHTDIYTYSRKSNASKDYEAFLDEFLGG